MRWSSHGGQIRRATDRSRLAARRVGPVLALSLLIGALIGPAGAADGDLDPTFEGDGKVVSDLGFDDRAEGVAVQPDGRIVIAGTSCNGDFLVARYHADGNPDPSFDGDGWVCIDLNGGSVDQGQEVLALDDGKLLVAGTSADNFALIRLNADGSLDPTFGTAGTATYDFAGVERLRDLALGPDGKIVMVGETTGTGCPTAPTMPGQTVGVAVARTSADGVLDPGFGPGGRVVFVDSSKVQRGFAVAVQPDAAVVITGLTASCSRVVIDSLVFRVTPAGEADPNFSAVDVLGEQGPDAAVDVALQPDGKVVVLVDTFVGPATSPMHDDAFTVIRYNHNGSPDASFGAGGVTALFGTGTNATATSLALQGDRIVVGGSLDGDFALLRFNPDGSQDGTFGSDGKVIDIGGADSIAAVAVQPDDKVVAAGRTSADVALARFGIDIPPTTSSSTSSTTTTTVPPDSAICALLRQLAQLPFVGFIIQFLLPLFGCSP